MVIKSCLEKRKSKIEKKKKREEKKDLTYEYNHIIGDLIPLVPKTIS